MMWESQPQEQHQGNGFYSPCACWSQSPYNAQWYGVLSAGCYWRSLWGTFWVNSRIYQEYMRLGAECGSMGLPIGDSIDLAGAPWNLSGWRVQYFYNPNTPCALNYIYQLPPGNGDSPNWTIHGSIANYYC